MKVGALYKDSRGWRWKHTMVAKINVTNGIFGNYMILNFNQANIEKKFINYILNKVIQLPTIAIVKRNSYWY